MGMVYFRACLTLLMVCAAAATTADDGIGPREGNDEQPSAAFVGPSIVMANMVMNVGALTIRPTAAGSSASVETIEPGFVLLTSIDRYVEDTIERRNSGTITSPWSDFAKLYRALAAGADAEVVQAYVNGTCGGASVNVIYWGQDGDRTAENITGKLGYGSFKRSHDSSTCEAAYMSMR